jgi:hypothetical protein
MPAQGLKLSDVVREAVHENPAVAGNSAGNGKNRLIPAYISVL